MASSSLTECEMPQKLLQGMELTQGPNCFFTFESIDVFTITPVSKGCSLPVVGCSGSALSWETRDSLAG